MTPDLIGELLQTPGQGAGKSIPMPHYYTAGKWDSRYGGFREDLLAARRIAPGEIWVWTMRIPGASPKPIQCPGVLKNLPGNWGLPGRDVTILPIRVLEGLLKKRAEGKEKGFRAADSYWVAGGNKNILFC